MQQLGWREYTIATLVYVITLLVVFFIINILHFNFYQPKIVLHAVIFDTILTIIVAGFLLKFVKFLPFNPVLLTNACLIFFLLASLYNVLIPTMCDRSLSVFILVKLKEADNIHQTMTTKALIQATNTQYIRDGHMVEKRLLEQQASGAIKIEQGVITLTPMGKLAANIFNFFYWALNIPHVF